MNGLTCEQANWSATVMPTARMSSGTVPIQYLLQSIAARIERARAQQPHLAPLERDAREDEPRRDRRRARSPASPRFRNEMIVTSAKGIRSPEWIGSDLMLKM